MKVNMKNFELICDKCGRTAPIDEKMSTPAWTVYRAKEPCECGGSFKPRYMVESAHEDT